MAIMTNKELQYRQGWTLQQKIDHSVGSIEAFISRTGKVPYVSFSGGKDSTVLLDLVRRFVDHDIKGVFCNTGNEWPENVKFVREQENVITIKPDISIKDVLNIHGFPLISKEQAQYIREAKTTKSDKLRNQRLNGAHNKIKSGKISDKWQFLINEKFNISEKCCKCLKKNPFRKYEKQTGEVPILGIMACESQLRKSSYIRRGGCNSFDGKHIASYPLSIWTDDDIWAYIKMFNIPYSKIYNKIGIKQTGCMFCGFGAHIKGDTRFKILRDMYPKAYDMFMCYQNSGITYRESLKCIGVDLTNY